MGAIDRVFRSRRPSQERPLAAIVAGLWKNGEQGVWYDVEGFRDAWNSVGSELTPAVAPVFGEASVVSPGVYRIYSSAGAFSSVGAVASATAVIGRKYIVSFNVDSITTLGGGLVVESVENPAVTTLGPKFFLVTAANTSLHIKRNSSACDLQISGVSAKEWLGRDSCTLYQDASGALPAYMPGQGQVDPPVGLLLDKRLGLVRGPDMVTNGDFATEAGWANTSGSDWTFGTGAAVRTATALANGFQTNIPAHVAGRYYLVSFEITAVTNAGAGISAYLGAAPTPPVTSPGKYSFFVLSDGTAPSLLRFYPRGSSNFFAGSVDNVSLQAIPGNHAYQTTTTSRPTLSARYNWATFTEDLTASVWQKGTPAFTITPKATLAPDGVSLADIVVYPDSGTPVLAHALTAQAPSVALSFFIKPISNATALSLLFRNNTTATNYDGTTLNTVNGTAGVPAWVVTPAGNGWLKISYARATGITAGDQISIYAGAAGAAAVPGRIWSVWGLDVRSGNDGVGLPPYQRVKDANTYDTAGFPLYLRFDGVDDWLRTPDIDFSGVTALFVAAAARKLSDAARGTLCELSSSYSNPGSFALEAPGITLNSFMFAHTGATTYKTLYRQLPAPMSAVVVGVSDLPSGYVRLSAKSPGYAQMSDVTTDVGGGSYATASLFIGRRAGSSQPFNGRLYSLYIRGGSSTAAQLSAVERHMNQQARIY